MIHIDGGMGEGGGQVLRSSLSLSLVTGQPFHIDNIRIRRDRPGLLAQHLTAVRAAAAVSAATVEGDQPGSLALTFSPGHVRGGPYAFDVGTAGSATLVLQTVLPALVGAGQASSLTVTGGTHNDQAPPFPFLERAFAPLLRRMGARVELTLDRCGFYPRGGGVIRARVEPAGPLSPLHLERRGDLLSRRAVAAVAGLPRHISERELAVLACEPGWRGSDLEALELPADQGPGNAAWVMLEFEDVCEVFTGFGRKGLPAGRVAGGIVRQMRRYLDSGAAVGEYLADQLLLPMALAGSGTLLTVAPSLHSTTNMAVIAAFLPRRIEVQQRGQDLFQLQVGS